MKLIKKLNVKLWVLLQLSCDRLQVIKLLSTTGNVESAMVVLQRVKAYYGGLTAGQGLLWWFNSGLMPALTDLTMRFDIRIVKQFLSHAIIPSKRFFYPNVQVKEFRPICPRELGNLISL